MAIDLAQNRMYGYFEHSIDDKGRIIVPQRFRELLGEEFVLSMGPSNCVRAYPKPVWEQVEAEYASTSVTDEYDSTALLLQRMIGSCDYVSLDAQNRVTIPRFLQKWADLSDSEHGALLGLGSHIEIRKVSAMDAIRQMCTEDAVNRANIARRANSSITGADSQLNGETVSPGSNPVLESSATAETNPTTV